ncbi:MAG: hypothetical protein AVDCRST_MAG49-4116 [uncultured Thermomicrobiales bacterium]|uniref:N-acetyltransferase domain-containing protein n=1 Tax=uncultured Thermomicrobiales bacterium TaxID=1645740 RepID=A0A6J4VGU6_9BACT|nr:MAG: hypothetical protein AVDCRST_MAG49-4116 [uncultured Thermomicrobiales bacterium]
MPRPPGGAAPPAPRGPRIAEVRDEEGPRAFEHAIPRGFELPELDARGAGAEYGVGVLADDRFRLWVGWEGDRPVSAAAASAAAGISDVTPVATVPEARRRGYGAALTWRVTMADPTLPALLLATDEGLPSYERIGYAAVARFTLWSRDRPARMN